MRFLDTEEITRAVRDLCLDININLADEIADALDASVSREDSPPGKEILQQLQENARIAREKGIPFCQDTGITIVHVRLGCEVKLKGDLYDAINKGVAAGYTDGYLRKSVVSDPLRRVNTGDNTPAMIHLELVEGDRVSLRVMAKGAGAENMSRMKMLTPAEGIDGVKSFIIETVELAGANACPPVILGIGIGGTFDEVGWLAKKALMRPLGSRNPDPLYADLEREVLTEVNNLGIGPMGLGGRVTALDARIEFAPCHISSLPVAVNIDCPAHRVKEVVI